MKKVFLAAPFQNKIVNGRLEEDYRDLLTSIKGTFESAGSTVHLAMERENWGADFWTDEACTERDYQEIKAADLIVALFDGTYSGGLHVELGWASAMRKDICILKKKDKDLCSLVSGLKVLTPCSIIDYSNPEEMLNKLNDYITRWNN